MKIEMITTTEIIIDNQQNSLFLNDVNHFKICTCVDTIFIFAY